MTDAPPEEPKGVSFSIIDTWKLKLPSVYLALPPDFINNVGGIVIAWGMFEKAFEDLLASMLLQTGNANKGWQNFSFEQKRGMFLAELPLCFEQEPELIGRLTALVAETHALQIKRNVLVHGQLTVRLASGLAELIAQGVFKKQPIIETFTTETINDFYYDVLHLAGRMVEFARPDAAEYVPPLPSQEISLLQAVLSKIRVLVPSYP